MKLDTTDFRYLSTDVFRVLTATEMGSKNHEIVPTSLICQISGLRSGGVNKCMGELAKRGLVKREANAKYEGYRLTYGGYDYLAIRALSKRDTVCSVGNQIGTGKESDVYVVAGADGSQRVLKVHRLGRISFRAIKSKRDYLQKRHNASWMYMSRLAAQKEYSFMKVLHAHGFPVPTPIDQARHTVVMSLIDAFPLRQIQDLPNPGGLYSRLMDLIVRLAKAGLIHGDYNEFNILIKEPPDEEDEQGNTIPGRGDVEPILIDFPQMVSTKHENAEYYFNRDVTCIRTFFSKRFGYESQLYPRFRSTVREGQREMHLDVEVEASGWGRGESRKLEEYMEIVDQAKDEGDSDEGIEGNEGSEQDCSSDPEEEGLVSPEIGVPGAGTDHPGSGLNETVGGCVLPALPVEGLSLAEQPTLSLKPPNPAPRRPKPDPDSVTSLVAARLAKEQAFKERRFHSRKSVRSAGRGKGSKAKTDCKALVSTEF